MKAEEDGFLIEIKRELLGVEASLLPIDTLYKDAQQDHDEAKIRSYSEEREKLIASRDRLHKEIEEAKRLPTSEVSKLEVDYIRKDISIIQDEIKLIKEDIK